MFPMGNIIDIIIKYIEDLGYVGLFILMVLDSTLLPLPSEVVLSFTGYLVYLGKMDLILATLVTTAASLVGAMVNYVLGYYVGYNAVLRIGRYFGVSERYLEIARNWFDRYGGPSVMFARLVPGLRALISIPAGVARMNIPKFLVYTAIGSFLWNLIFIYLGFRLGSKWEIVIRWAADYFMYITILLIIVVVALVITRRIRRLH